MAVQAHEGDRPTDRAGRSQPDPGHAVVWSPRYLSYTWAKGHPMNPVRLDLTMSLATSIGLLEGVEVIEPAAASEPDLLRIHTASYIEAVKDIDNRPPEDFEPRDDAPSDAPFGLGNSDNPIFPHMHEASSIIVGGTLAAAREIAAGRARRAVSIGGGMHHALAASASGFCVYNDAAVAISWLLDNGYDRIAYIDVDVHHGDGVERAFQGDPRVLTVSIHQHPATLWPGTGWSSEVGIDAGAGRAVNLPVLPGTSDPVWLRAFHAVVPGAIAAFAPQIIISQCGVDTHREDPLADLSLSVDGQRAAFLAMRDLADRYAEGRWLAVGGGGYGLVRVVPRSWTHVIAAALDRDIDPATPIPEEWNARISRLAPTVELPTTMGDGELATYLPWDGPGGAPETGDSAYDRALVRVDGSIQATRRAVFPLLGLDPDDPRD